MRYERLDILPLKYTNISPLIYITYKINLKKVIQKIDIYLLLNFRMKIDLMSLDFFIKNYKDEIGKVILIRV